MFGFGLYAFCRGLAIFGTPVPKSALDNDGCRNSAINKVVKEIYRYSGDQNFSIQTFYVPSLSNPANEPSRKCSDLDCMLSVEIRTSAFKLSTCLLRVIPLTSLRGSVRIWTVCFLSGLGYLWDACSVLIYLI